MKLNQHLKDWKQIISYRFPRLSLPQISGLATWSFGMVMTQSSSLTKVSTLIAKVNQEQENTVRQRLKEWYKSGEAKAKKGKKPTLVRSPSLLVSQNKQTKCVKAYDYISSLEIQLSSPRELTLPKKCAPKILSCAKTKNKSAILITCSLS